MYEECFDLARRNFQPFPRAQLVRGKVPDTLSQAAIEKVSYLSLDMNIAAPEIAAIEFFWDKLAEGAFVLLDDYGWTHHVEQKCRDGRLRRAQGSFDRDASDRSGFIDKTSVLRCEGKVARDVRLC